MGYTRIKNKFPCGTEIEIEFGFFAGHLTWSQEDFIYPLHGKGCKSQPIVQSNKKSNTRKKN